jgi:predicted restriction endonuclease
VGRAKRLATAHQRRALAARYETCAIPGCSVLFHRCEPHHLRPWEDGGGTDLSNLLPLCVKHHHAVHEGGWTLDVDSETGNVRVTYPS